MNSPATIRIALQKSGRLHDKSIALLARCGLGFEIRKDALLVPCNDFPLELMLVRDDDIPEYVRDGVCTLGIVGDNVLQEKLFKFSTDVTGVTTVRPLGFGGCRLAIAVPQDFTYTGPDSLSGLRIATTYSGLLRRFLDQHQVRAEIIPLTGSVEIAPAIAIADAICDLVASGETLRSNGLRAVETILRSEALLVRSAQCTADQQVTIDRLLQRINGVLQAAQLKYIMMNAPRTALPAIQAILPGMESPSIIPLGNDGAQIAIHAVAREDIFWETMERLKNAGASSILVVPIEKIIE